MSSIVRQEQIKYLYFLTGNSPNEELSSFKEMMFHGDSQISFENLFSFLKKIPIELGVLIPRHRNKDLHKDPIRVSIYHEQKIILMIKLFNYYSKVYFKSACTFVSIKTERIKDFKFQNFLIFNYTLSSLLTLSEEPLKFPRNHPFKKVGQVLELHSNSLFTNFIRPFIYSERTMLNRQEKGLQGSEIDSYIRNEIGHFKIGLYDSIVDRKLLTYDNKSVQYLVWIAPWAHAFISKGGYFQIDASFAALFPYVYAVPLLIQNNASIPLGISIGPSEHFLLFNLFFDFLQSIYNLNLKDLIILSDEGKAIEKFVNNLNDATHFFCFRHLIEKLGSFTPIASIARRLLFKNTLDLYEAALCQAISDVNVLIENKQVTNDAVLKFIQIFGLEMHDGKVIQGKTTNHKNGLWCRAPFGVSTCSNHIERLHRTLNESTQKSRSIAKKFFIVITQLKSYYSNYSEHSRRQAKELLKKLINVASDSSKRIVTKSSCECGWGDIYTCRFGTEFPCVHTVLSKKYVINDLERPNDIDTNQSITIEPMQPDWHSVRFLNTGEKILDSLEIEIIESMKTTHSEDEINFIFRVANDINYLNKFKGSFSDLLINISIKWGETISKNINLKNDINFRSHFLSEIFNLYSDI